MYKQQKTITLVGFFVDGALIGAVNEADNPSAANPEFWPSGWREHEFELHKVCVPRSVATAFLDHGVWQRPQRFADGYAAAGAMMKAALFAEIV